MSKFLAERFKRKAGIGSRDGWDGSPDALAKAVTPNTPNTPGAYIGVLGVADTVQLAKDPSHPSATFDLTPQTLMEPGHAIQVTYPQPFPIQMGDREHIVRFWKGETLDSPAIGFDTETALIAGHEIPPLALASASTGDGAYLIHPDDVARFLEMHRDRHLVFHNVAFDFWVLVEHFRTTGKSDAAAMLWRMVEANQLHDTMRLDELVRLGADGTTPIPRGLAEVALDWAKLELNKDDPYRLRYSEMIGQEWGKVDSGFFIYAAKDPIATILAYHELKAIAAKINNSISQYIWPDAVPRFGLLTEVIQVKGGIALEQIGRTGMYCDREKLNAKKAELSSRMEILIQELLVLPETEGLFKRNKGGLIQRTKTGLPSMKEKRLQEILENVLKNSQAKSAPPVPRTNEGLLSAGEEYWLPYTECAPFVDKWIELIGCGKMLGFTQPPDGERIHPHYSVLMRTGRTSCSNPNLQQLPREGGFRECYVSSPGHVLLTIDYSYIELATLAAICIRRFGKSQLAEVIRRGIDPHCYTAALIIDMPLDEFMALKMSDPDRFKDLRQKAKALNFGIPGGLGAVSLMDYARKNYGVVLTQEQAVNWRNKVISEIYPELSLYLADRTMSVLSTRLGCSVDALWDAIDEKGDRPGWMPIVVQRVLRGDAKKDGTPYNINLADRIWSGLARCCHNLRCFSLLQTRQAGAELGALCDDDAVTPTGRVRARVLYTECRNSPFQGLAADGAKLACFNLLQAGYRLVGFVHDEFIIELPDTADYAAEAKRIESIVTGGMSEVVNQTVPVRAEYTVATCWSKKAKLLVAADGRITPWSPE